MTQTDTTFTNQERLYLIGLLENRLGETRVEVHRTHTPDFREQVKQEEELVREILSKLRF